MIPDDASREGGAATVSVRLGRIAHARSGDKGTAANIGVIVGSQAAYHVVRDQLTAERVSEFFRAMGVTEVTRYELPNLLALNFVLRGILSRGTRVDAQGKALGQAILEMPIELPEGGLPAD